MSEENGTKVPLSRDDENVAPVESKGKGKAVAAGDEEESVPVVDDDDMDDEEESGVEDTEVGVEADDAEEEDEEDMAEIDTGNIISGGRRTRGKNIDFAKAAQEAGDEEEDEEEDEDFVDPEAMQE